MRLLGALAALGGLALGVLAADGPNISQKKFPAPPINLFYFDDSETVMMLDPEHLTIWRSEDAGEEWKKVEEIPGNVGYIIPNPHDSSVAIAVGTARKHWITYNRGKDWRSFTTSEPATGDYTKEPFSFHGNDNKRILFHSQEDCLFGDACVGKVGD